MKIPKVNLLNELQVCLADREYPFHVINEFDDAYIIVGEYWWPEEKIMKITVDDKTNNVNIAIGFNDVIQRTVTSDSVQATAEAMREYGKFWLYHLKAEQAVEYCTILAFPN